MDVAEQLKRIEETQKRQRFADAINANSGITITADDIAFTISMSDDARLILAMLAVAKARIDRESEAVPETKPEPISA